MSAEGDVVHGLRAAAKLSGWSPSGLQKMVDGGRVLAERVGRSYTFRVVDLESIRRAIPPQPSGLPTASLAGAPSPAPRADAPADDRPEVAAATPSNAADNAQDDGAVAAVAFADFRAGKSVVDVVIDRRLAPDVVRRFHAEWLALSDVDTLRKPPAEARLVQVEADIQALDGRLRATEDAVHAASTQAARGRQDADARSRALSARSQGASVPAAIYQRLNVLEAQVRSLPAAPLPIGHRCPGCGGAVVVPSACSGCGAGRLSS